jgi:hypothetical protein
MVMPADPWAEYERIALADPASLPTGQQRLLAVGGLRTELNNGGFDQYFFNPAGDLAAIAVQAAEQAGATELASLIHQALELLNAADPADQTARQDALHRLKPEDFEPLDQAYYALEAATDLDDVMRSVMR